MKKAFTLTELLIALTIIGIIAAMSIPSLLNNFQKKVYAAHLKNTVSMLKQLADEQIMQSPSKSLSGTIFDSADTLFVKKYFNITEKISSDAEEVEYATIVYPKERGQITIKAPNVRLKNGITLGYTKNSSGLFGLFSVDLNGDDAPNIIGRDYFEFYISKDGRFFPINSAVEELDLEEAPATCKGGDALACYGLIVDNGWKMDY